jgi:hypothetical protein
MNRRLIRLLVPILALVAIPAMAVDGQIPIPFTSPIVTPITITAPGSYVVTQNLMPTAPGPIISIALPAASPVDDVQIDLNGMVLDNSPNPGAPVIAVVVAAGGGEEVTIRNGTLVGGSTGIEAFGPARKLVVEDVKISDFTTLAHLGGIHTLDVFNTVVRRCVIVDAAGPPGAAIFLDGGIPRQATIEDNLIQNTFDGIDALPGMAGIEISNNRFRDILGGGPFGAAINLDGSESCLISQNTINGMFGPAPATGIRLNFSRACKVVNNVVSAVTADHGIHLGPGTVGTFVLDNVVGGSGGDGLRVEGNSNHIERNTLTGNGGFGLRLFGAASFDNHVGRNVGSLNGGGGPPCFPPGFWSPDLCDDPAVPGPLAGPNWSFFDNLMPGGLGPI